MYASEEDEGPGCGDDVEADRGVRGDMSFMSIGREEMSEGFEVMP